jgi:hypothetical protein
VKKYLRKSVKNGENSLTQFNNKNGIFKPLSARDFDDERLPLRYLGV